MAQPKGENLCSSRFGPLWSKISSSTTEVADWQRVKADRSFRDGQSGNTLVGVQGPLIEGCTLMVEKVEKHEGLQDLAEV